MTKQERLKFCNVCKNQKSSLRYGITCKLTNEEPQFEESCSTYEEDEDLKKRLHRLVNDMDMMPVGPGKRFANLFIDAICYYFFCMILGFFLGIIIAIINPQKITLLSENKLFAYSLAYLAWFTYYTLFESFGGRTVGKMITGTKVVTETGETPAFGTIAIRSVTRLIPFEAFSFLGDGTGWHDSFSKTMVVDARKKQ